MAGGCSRGLYPFCFLLREGDVMIEGAQFNGMVYRCQQHGVYPVKNGVCPLCKSEKVRPKDKVQMSPYVKITVTIEDNGKPREVVSAIAVTLEGAMSLLQNRLNDPDYLPQDA